MIKNLKNNKINLFGFVLLFVILFSLHASSVQAFAGSGTSLDPYIITTCAELQTMNDALSASYKLGNDIDCSGTSNPVDPLYNAGAGFLPVGDITVFSGTFNGDGKKITGLFINRPAHSDVGLFGFTISATISNVGVEGANISGNTSVGILAGESYSNISNSYSTGTVNGISSIGGLVGLGGDNRGKIINSYSTATVNGSGGQIGGFVGSMNGGPISNSYSTGNVIASGSTYVGGFVGANEGSIISNSYSTGAVTGSNYVGGFDGENGIPGDGNSGTIIDSYSTGPVTGTTYVGGFAGMSYSIINNSYSIGTVTGATSFGGLVGSTNGTGTINYSYWNTDIFATDNGLGVGKNTTQMKNQSTFTSGGPTWNFISFWKIDGATNSGYPFLLPLALPTVTTNASPITFNQTSATLQGNITNVGGGSNITVRGLGYGTTSHSSSTSISDYSHVTTDSSGAPFGTGIFNTDISSLSCDTQYFYRAYATNILGDSLGSEQNFTTSACASLPTVTTSASPLSFTQTSATLQGNITSTGSGTLSEKGFHWRIHGDGHINTESTTSGLATGLYSLSISTLACNTEYDYEAYATSGVGEGDGSVESFTTSSCAAASSSSLTITAPTVLITTPVSPVTKPITVPPITISPITLPKVCTSSNLLSPITGEICTIKLTGLIPGPTTINMATLVSLSISSVKGTPPGPTMINTSTPGVLSLTSKSILIPTLTNNIQLITTNLSVGMSANLQIKILQQFLINQNKGIAAKALSANGTTLTFGPLTQAALAEWQKAVGITPASGYFGPITQAKIKALGL